MKNGNDVLKLIYSYDGNISTTNRRFYRSGWSERLPNTITVVHIPLKTRVPNKHPTGNRIFGIIFFGLKPAENAERKNFPNRFPPEHGKRRLLRAILNVVWPGSHVELQRGAKN